MKKLLAMLTTITSLSGITPIILANAPAEISENKIINNEINYQQTNNLEKLNRSKRENNDKIENYYCFLCPNRLVAKISHDTWKKISDNYAKTTSLEQDYNYVRGLLNNFEKRNSSGDINKANYFSDDDLKILANVIVYNFSEINDFFKIKRFDEMGLIIKTNRNSYWAKADDEDNDFFWGVYLNFNEKILDEINEKNGTITKWVSVGAGIAVAIVATAGAAAAVAGGAGAGAAAATGGVAAYEASIVSVGTTASYATAATSLTAAAGGGAGIGAGVGIAVAGVGTTAAATSGSLGITATLAGLGSKISAIAAKIGPTVTVISAGTTLAVNSKNLFKNPDN
ncbi:hypothetical protein [Spiroplasma endosymbiont of Nephrotoma flavescens]|uniref:hypothetical protein n=1 Tax=Spiroplasma endosymbiont of Nephrotoma flavescens TaxID=3066302 RepID=UPI00313F14CC